MEQFVAQDGAEDEEDYDDVVVEHCILGMLGV